MAALDFPSAPSVGQTYTAGGRTWKWDGTTWLSTAGINSYTVVSKTTTYTAVAGDMVKCDASGAAFTVTLPAAASNTNAVIQVKKTDSSANAVTVDGNASETIDGALTYPLGVQYESVTLVCDGSNWHVL